MTVTYLAIAVFAAGSVYSIWKYLKAKKAKKDDSE
jgi:hypothetical protein